MPLPPYLQPQWKKRVEAEAKQAWLNHLHAHYDHYSGSDQKYICRKDGVTTIFGMVVNSVSRWTGHTQIPQELWADPSIQEFVVIYPGRTNRKTIRGTRAEWERWWAMTPPAEQHLRVKVKDYGTGKRITSAPVQFRLPWILDDRGRPREEFECPYEPGEDVPHYYSYVWDCGPYTPPAPTGSTPRRGGGEGYEPMPWG